MKLLNLLFGCSHRNFSRPMHQRVTCLDCGKSAPAVFGAAIGQFEHIAYRDTRQRRTRELAEVYELLRREVRQRRPYLIAKK